MIGREISTLLHAIGFFTRIPVALVLKFSESHLQQSLRYFPLMGWITGGIAGGVFWLCHQVFPQPVSVLLAMTVSILVTGAFHEDGLADTCDGMGGPGPSEKILQRMKDSRLGTYGVTGLVLVLALKFNALNAMPPNTLPLIFISSAAFSRLNAVFLFLLPYVNLPGASRSGLIVQSPGPGTIIISLIIGMVPLIFHSQLIWIAIIPPIGITIFLGFLFYRRLGGFTGDCAGAVQQLTEVVFLLSLLGIS